MPRHRREVYRVTSLQPEPSAEFVSRERTYLVMMGVRMVAIVVAVVVSGPLRWIAIAMGVLIPYFAVIIANQTNSKKAPPVLHQH
jgi:Flp pilus assembly protein TadB